MRVDIREEVLSDELKGIIDEGFAEHSYETVGRNGDMKTFSLVARESDVFLGAVVAKTFWGGLHIKNLYVIPRARGEGIGREMMARATNRGKELGCRFAFVETMSFQGIDFYRKLGFQPEFIRKGYDGGTSFHYLRKDF